jgi:hypothetical protein
MRQLMALQNLFKSKRPSTALPLTFECFNILVNCSNMIFQSKRLSSINMREEGYLRITFRTFWILTDELFAFVKRSPVNLEMFIECVSIGEFHITGITSWFMIISFMSL